MPRKSDNIPINNKKLDRRIKLTEQQRAEIKENKQGLSQRKLAKLYGVSRRTVSFILDPQKLERCKELRALRGGSKYYYNREKHTKAIKEHREYKKELYRLKLIKEKK